MRKLSQITESVWSDIQDRSVGQSSRKEDILDDIFKCIDTNYQVINTSDNITYKKREKIYFYIYKCLGLSSYASICIYPTHITFATINTNKYKSATLKKFVADIKDELNQLYKKIMDNYSVERSEFDGLEHWYDFTVYPKDRKMTKEFCMEFIDFILDEIRDDNHWIAKTLKKKNMNESVWSDIQDRSSGESVRKEDDIEGLSLSEFVDYLNELYEYTNHSPIINAMDDIDIYLLRTKDGVLSGWPVHLLLLNYSGNRQISFSNKGFGKNFCLTLYKKLDKIFTFKKDVDGFPVIVPPNNAKVTNRFFIEVIETIIDNMDSQYEEIHIRKK